MFDTIYIPNSDKLKAGSICYGSKGEPLEYVDRDGDRIKLFTPVGKASTNISNIKLVQHEDYHSFRWLVPPGARLELAATKAAELGRSVNYHPRQIIAIGEWSKPTQETHQGGLVNKRIDYGTGRKRSIPDTLPVIWVDDSKVDLSYQPPATEQVDNLPAPIKPYQMVSKVYIDIETTGLDPTIDRITMFGIRDGEGNNFIFTNPDERVMLAEAILWLDDNQPELIFLHNGYTFDIPFIIYRCALHGINHPFNESDRGIWRQIKKNTHPALKRAFIVEDDTAEYGGKLATYEAFGGNSTVIDTMIALGLWDTAKKLRNLKLKESVIKLKLRADSRLELSNDEIQACWVSGDLDRLTEYLVYDLEDTQLIADKLMPAIWYQQAYLPNVSIMNLVHKNTGFKIQKMYEYLSPNQIDNIKPDTKADYGGGLTGAVQGIYRYVNKIDVASLYPSLMVRYSLGSRKDTTGKYISVLRKMLTDRLEYKRLGEDILNDDGEVIREGDREAAGMSAAIKLLMNSGYGYLGTPYPFNDMENAALITAYGRVILRLMCQVIVENNGTLISADTDGVYYSHPDATSIFDKVSTVLPDGIKIELEKLNLLMFSKSKKNYCLYKSNGELIDRKGNTFLSYMTELENDFVYTYPGIYINQGQTKADEYYRDIIADLKAGKVSIDKLAKTELVKKESTNILKQLGETESGVYTYYITRHDYHRLNGSYGKARVYRDLKTKIECYPETPYFAKFYTYKIDVLRANMLGISEPEEYYKNMSKTLKPVKVNKIKQLTLEI
jgi:DNA polymerase, archaea type